MGWPPAWAGIAINLGLFRGWLWLGWWFLVLKLKLQSVEMLTLFFSCLHEINCDRSSSSVPNFPQMTSVNPNLPSRMCEAPGILCGWIMSLAWLVPLFCFPPWAVCSLCSLLLQRSRLKFLYQLGIYSVLQRLLTAFSCSVAGAWKRVWTHCDWSE